MSALSRIAGRVSVHLGRGTLRATSLLHIHGNTGFVLFIPWLCKGPAWPLGNANIYIYIYVLHVRIITGRMDLSEVGLTCVGASVQVRDRF